jgi:uncharacterized membrane protein
MPWEWDIDPQEAPASSGASAYGAPSDARHSFEAGDAPLARLHAWPYRSLPKRGFALTIGAAYVLLLIPISGFIGTLAMWWLLIPGLAAIWALKYFIEKSYRDGEILEELTLWRDHIRLDRHGPRGRHQHWEANPYWVTLHQHRGTKPVKHYLTLKGNNREVELGAFLHEDERPALHDALAPVLVQAKSPSREGRPT